MVVQYNHWRWRMAALSAAAPGCASMQVLSWLQMAETVATLSTGCSSCWNHTPDECRHQWKPERSLHPLGL